MAQRKISELPELTAPDGAEELVVNDSGVSKKVTVTNIVSNTDPKVHTHTVANITDAGDAASKNVGTITGTVSAGDHNHTGTYEPADATILKDADIGVTVHAYDANIPTFPAGVSSSELGYLDGVTSAIQTQINGKSAGDHNHTGTYEPADATILKDADIGVNVEAYDATILKDADIGVNVEAYNANIQTHVTSAHAPSNAEANAANTAITTTDQSWTGSQRGTTVTDNDGSFDMNGGNNFKCTPAGAITLTFTNITDGQSGFILLVNSGGQTVSAHANTKVDANLLATVSTAGTYLCSYFSDGTNAYLTNSAVYA